MCEISFFSVNIVVTNATFSELSKIKNTEPIPNSVHFPVVNTRHILATDCTALVTKPPATLVC